MNPDEIVKQVTVAGRRTVTTDVSAEVRHWCEVARVVAREKKKAFERVEREVRTAKEEHRKDHIRVIKELGDHRGRRNSWVAHGLGKFDGYGFVNGAIDYVWESVSGDEEADGAQDEYSALKEGILRLVSRTAEDPHGVTHSDSVSPAAEKKDEDWLRPSSELSYQTGLES